MGAARVPALAPSFLLTLLLFNCSPLSCLFPCVSQGLPHGRCFERVWEGKRVGGRCSAPLSRPRSSLARTAFFLLLLISATWLLGLLAVNSDALTFRYLFAVFGCLQVGGCQSDLAGPRGHLSEMPQPRVAPRGSPGRSLTWRPGCVLALWTHGAAPWLSFRCRCSLLGVMVKPRGPATEKKAPVAPKAALPRALPGTPIPWPPVYLSGRSSLLTPSPASINPTVSPGGCWPLTVHTVDPD